MITVMMNGKRMTKKDCRLDRVWIRAANKPPVFIYKFTGGGGKVTTNDIMLFILIAAIIWAVISLLSCVIYISLNELIILILRMFDKNNVDWE